MPAGSCPTTLYGRPRGRPRLPVTHLGGHLLRILPTRRSVRHTPHSPREDGMRLHRTAFVAASVLVLICAPGLIATAAPSVIDTEVTVGSDDTYFSQNKQNEPGVAVNPVDTAILAAGANDNIDLERCNAGDPTHLPVHPGRRRVGRAVLDRRRRDLGHSRPTPGYSARNASCRPVPPATTPGCVPDGRRRSARCPTTSRTAWSPTVTRRWSSGRRRTPTARSRGTTAAALLRQHRDAVPGQRPGFNGDAAITVSRTDDLAGADGRRERRLDATR